MQTVNSVGYAVSGQDGIAEGGGHGCCVGQKYFVQSVGRFAEATYNYILMLHKFSEDFYWIFDDVYFVLVECDKTIVITELAIQGRQKLCPWVREGLC